ncbi:gp58-like family protein, partial [Latilactobacillus curvatus]|uniref:gp58-like family protein n=1 Tax=Latilactobacillus curvatus TaxID=28038 RepID=UPI0023DA8755
VAIVFATQQSTPSNVSYKEVKLEKGSIATDWSANPADNATVTAVSSISQTVEDMKFDISKKIEQKDLNGYATQTWAQSQIKSTADSINLNVSKVQTDLSGTKTQFAELAVKVDGIQTTVSGKADQSQVTQLAGQITSVVGDVSANSSQITQMKADINLRVKAGDVINQINISPESILIAGQKVHITGQTTIDNAVIKDAMIANVKADKITAGTLDAANVNVINLNAANITTGTLKGANLSMNLNTGEVLFQKGAIRSTNGNLNIDIESGRMAVMDKNGDGFFFEDGMLLLSNSWDTGNAIKYGSITYGAGFPGNGRGIIIKGVSGATLETKGHSDFGGVLTESGINVYPNQIRMTSVGQVNIVGGSEYSIGYVKNRASINIGSSVSGTLGDRIVMNADYIHLLATYSQTASGSANVIVAEDGALVRSTSASKYKTDIIRANATDYGDKLLNLPTATWTDIAETKRYRDDPVNQIKPTRNFGMIAEDLADAGLEMLVVRGTDGELEGINYDRIGPALIPVIAKLKNEVETLKQKLEEPA